MNFINKHRNFFKLLGVLNLGVAGFLFLQAFLTAYFNVSKSVVIYINNYGEANLEFYILIPYLVITGLISIVLNIQDCYKK